LGSQINRRRHSTSFVAALVAGAIIICTTGWSRTGPAAEPQQDAFQFPETPAGRVAEAYVRAFNSQDDAQMEGFLRDYRPQSYLQERPIEERLGQYRRLHDTFGTLTPLRAALSLDLQITFLAKGSNVGGVLVFRFQVDEAPPHKLTLLTTSGVDQGQLPDDETLRVADRAQPMNADVIQETARAVARILRERYIDPALGKTMADTILSRLVAGRCADAKKAGQLADALTEGAVAVSRDKHIWIEAANPFGAQSTYAENRPIEELRRENYHFRKVEILPGNVGYLKFDMIHDDQEAQDIVARAMASVRDCSVLIFDIRDNIGGEWESGRLILSYVLPESTIVSRTYDRDGRLVRTNATLDKLPGARFDATVPVYVLTSDRTGSAAEGFAYALQQSGRGTVVGETTLGMAHPCEEVMVNSCFIMSVPIYRVESAFAAKSLEGVGIIPDIGVPEENALGAALADAKARADGVQY